MGITVRFQGLVHGCDLGVVRHQAVLLITPNARSPAYNTAGSWYERF